MRKTAVISVVILAGMVWMISPLSFPAEQTDSPAGIYFCGPAGAKGAEDASYESIPELKYPYVTGVSYRQFWRNIEPEKGRYNWSSLENAYRQAKESGKWMMITVTAGMGSPEWVYEQGIPSVEFDSQEARWWGDSGAALRMPVPWNDRYLEEWEGFIRALGEKIKEWDRVYCVHMTGGGYISEMHLPKRLPQTVQQWESAGFSEELCIDAWKQIIDCYDCSIPPDVGLSVALSPVLSGMGCADEIFRWSGQKYPGRVWYQRNVLKERTAKNPDGDFSSQLHDASKYTTVGWQMAQLPGQDLVGNRDAAFQHALNTGSSFVEIYGVDLNNPALADALTALNNGLKKHAGASVVLPKPSVNNPESKKPLEKNKAQQNTGAKKTGKQQGKRLADTVWVKNPSGADLPENCTYGKYMSPSMGHEVGYVIYLPPEYEKTDNPLPVIYFLHGIGGDELGSAKNVEYLDAAIKAGDIRPCVAVYVNGAYSAFYSDSCDGKYMMETTFIQELIPHIEKNYRVIKDRSGRLIEGFSMGGHGTMKMTFKYPEMFCSAVSYAGALMELPGFSKIQADEFESLFENRAELYNQNSPLEMIKTAHDAVEQSGVNICIVVGTEDRTMRNGEQLHLALENYNIKHGYEVIDGARHKMSDYFEKAGSMGYKFHENSLKKIEQETKE